MLAEVTAERDRLAARNQELEVGFRRQADYAMRLSAHVSPGVASEIRKRSFLEDPTVDPITVERDRLAKLVGLAEAWLRAEDAFLQHMEGAWRSVHISYGDEEFERVEAEREAFRQALAAGKGPT